MTNEEVNEAVGLKLGHSLDAIRMGDGYDYATNILDAWEIVEHHFMEGFELEVFPRSSGDTPGWIATFRDELQVGDYPTETQVDYYKAKAETAPLAICLAFLKMG